MLEGLRKSLDLMEQLNHVTTKESKQDVLQVAITLAQLGVTPDDTESLVRTWHIARYANLCDREEFERIHNTTRRIIEAAGGWRHEQELGK